MFLFWKLVLTLLVGWFAVTGKYRIALGIAAVWLVLTFPDMSRFVQYWSAGVDSRQSLDAGHVDIRKDGPLEFTSYRDGPLYGETRYRHRTFVPLQATDGVAEVEFSVVGLSRQESFDFSGCPTKAANSGLLEIMGRGRGFCPARGLPNRVYADASGEKPFYLTCWPAYNAGRPAGENCAMTVLRGGMTVNVVMGGFPRAEWRGAVDHMVAIIDQSFTPVWN